MSRELRKAKYICKRAHRGQRDKANIPYYKHPFYVSNKMKTEEEKIVALLHDTVEDTYVTLEYLRKCGFDESVVLAIDHLTHREGETYDEYFRRVCENKIAMRVKLEDLKHNSDLSRINSPSEYDFIRTKRYTHYINLLEKLI